MRRVGVSLLRLLVTGLWFASTVYAFGSSSTLALVHGESPAVCGVISATPYRYVSCHTASQLITLNPRVSYSSIAGGSLLCGLLENSFTLLCWDKISNSSSSFKRLYNNATFPILSMSVGSDQICSIVNGSNSVQCWRGHGARPPTSSSQFISMSSGTSFSCGIRSDSRTLQCWGSDETAALIQSEFAGTELTSISCGGAHACGVDIAGKIMCKGANSSGQLNVPNRELQLSYSEVSLGFAHTCGIRANRSVVCWGGNFSDEYNSITQKLSFAVVSSGVNFSCGVISQNLSVACWGPGWPGSGVQVIPFPGSILPGQCVAEDSACNSCGVLPNSGELCGASGAICQLCVQNVSSSSSPGIVYVKRGRSKSLTRKLLVFVIIGSVGGFMGICSILYLVYKGTCLGKKKVHNSVQPTITRGSSSKTGSPNSNSGNLLSRSSTLRRQVSRALRRQRSGTSFKHADRAEEFSLREMEAATNGFSLENKIGSGSFGVVYKGKLIDGREVAIKRGSINMKTKRAQEKESAFQSELSFLSRLHHKYLVRLVGFCEDGDERLLVYEFMKYGALYDHLHNRGISWQGSPVVRSWKMRIKLSLDAARGIEYLHTYAVPPIIHRDIKSSNILIDAAWNARVSDFGLSLMGSDQSRLRPEKAVGTVGYMDPEYFGLNVVSDKTDVYCFGVVLLEIITGKTAIFKWDGGAEEGEEGEPTNLVDYAVPKIKADEIFNILDRRVAPPDTFETEAVELVGNTAMHCVQLEGKDRPTMTDIVANLDRALSICEEGSRGSVSSGIVSLVSD